MLQTVQDPFWGPYKLELQDALILYAQNANADTTTVSTILNSFAQDASNNFNGYYGVSDTDLYRAFQPEWSYHWGSDSPKASYASVNKQVMNAELLSGQEEDFTAYIDEVIHYFHGVNPLGKVMLSNMYDVGAERSINEIYHTWFYDGTVYDNALTSAIGPAPGFVTGGPNQSFTVTTLSPPAGQPEQKSYLDFNDGFPNNSWEISEPAIYYQSAYIRMLANRVETDGTLTVPWNELERFQLSISPNPATDQVQIGDYSPQDQVVLFDSQRRRRTVNPTPSGIVSLQGFRSGIYIVLVLRGDKIGVAKLIVQ